MDAGISSGNRLRPRLKLRHAQTIVLKCCELCEIVCEGGLLMSILELLEYF